METETMSAFEFTGTCRRGLPATAAEGPALPARGIVARLRAILRRMRAGHESRVAVRGLQSLSDWQLKDIGMHRGQIWHRAGGISAGTTRIPHAED
jgi:uncharacterized protein YjiS (DUF1127 family)